MEETKYKVEVFITPEINKCGQDDSINEIDDVKAANICKLNGTMISLEDDGNVKDKKFNDSVNEDHQNELNIAVLKNEEVCWPEKLSHCTSMNEKTEFHKTYNENILNDLIHDSMVKKTQAQKRNKLLDTVSVSDDLKKENQRGNCPPNKKPESGQKHVDVCVSTFPNVSKKNEPYDFFFPAKPLRKFTSLMSIDEQNEDADENLNDFCHHGYQNGCTASVPTPQEVSHAIFKENWLQKLETLRQKESLLKDKEISLQNRERTLFTREKQLRIRERSVMDKLKQVELYLKTCKCPQNFLETDVVKERALESRSSNESQELTNRDNDSVKSNDSKENPKRSIESLQFKTGERELCEKQQQSIAEPLNALSMIHGKTIRNPLNSRNSLISSVNQNSHLGRHGSYSSFKCKPRPKMTYDDLDSTLSADIGDASFVVTSRKFDPEVFKRPVAFRRSASERRIKQNSQEVVNVQPKSFDVSKEEQRHFNITEERILKRFSENIMVSQDHNTKFQDYGLIDQNIEDITDGRKKTGQITTLEEKSCSYLNLEAPAKIPKTNVARQKGRPVSWNEETDEWLLKKRHAYNLMTKKSRPDVCDNKENFQQQAKDDKSQKVVKKKDRGKAKILNIFR